MPRMPTGHGSSDVFPAGSFVTGGHSLVQGPRSRPSFQAFNPGLDTKRQIRGGSYCNGSGLNLPSPHAAGHRSILRDQPMSAGSALLVGEAQLTLSGQPVPADRVGALEPADPDADLMATLNERGYLLLRSVIDPATILTARNAVLQQLFSVAEIDAPPEAAIASGTSRRAERHADLGAFWRQVSEDPALRKAVHGRQLNALMDRLFATSAKPFDFVWLRTMAAGRASPLHMDHPYMNRGTDRLVTCWIPLGPVAIDEAPLYVIEGSHGFADLHKRFAGLDVDRNPAMPGHLGDDPLALAASRGSRLLTATFEPGDVLVFGMFTLHASFDNRSASGRVRISCDTRWQPASEPMDERFRGPDPPAHGGRGYGCLSAAQPMTAAAISR